MKRFIIVSLVAILANHRTGASNPGVPLGQNILGVGGGLVLPGISAINKLIPAQDNYNELNRDIISKHRAFRVIADEDFQYNCLDKMNRKRALHDSTRSLSLGYNFTKYTIERAHSILRDIENQQDITKGRYPLGESFFYYYDPNRYRTTDDAINTWYSESRNYDFNRPGFSAKTGGFTQLIWKSSREASCAKIEYETRDHYKTLLVCNFYPAGNVNGEFPYNVLPLKRGGGGGNRPGGGGRPDYDEDRPSRPGGGGGNRPGGGRPDYDEDRPSRPGGGGGGRPGRPDGDDRPNRPGGGGGGRPRPPYDDPDYDQRPNRPNKPGGGGGGYPTHPISVTGSTQTIVPLPSYGIVGQPETQPAQPAQPAPADAVLVAQVSPQIISSQPAQTLSGVQPVQYAAGDQILQPSSQSTGNYANPDGNIVYEPVEAILVLPQYGNVPPVLKPQL